MSILFPFAGVLLKFNKLDPLGGLLLAIYIIYEWFSTLYENVSKLTGVRADHMQHQRIAYLITRFSVLIKYIQNISVYHVGDNLVVEADVVLPVVSEVVLCHRDQRKNREESCERRVQEAGILSSIIFIIDWTISW